MTAKPIPMLTERHAAERAIAELEGGRSGTAVRILREALSRRTRPPKGPDSRSDAILHLRASIEQSIVEIEHPRGSVSDALRTLRRGLEGVRSSAKLRVVRGDKI